MAIKAVQLMSQNQRIQTVAVGIGIQLPRQTHGTQNIRRERLRNPAKFVFNEAVISARVVGNKYRAFPHSAHVTAQIKKARRVAHHCVRDAGQRLNFSRNRDAGIDQRLPA